MNVSRADWVRDDSKNALSGVNLAGIRKCFQTAGAVVFGWHYFYYAGRARSDVIFGSADELINLVEQARPGDHFSLYDMGRVRQLAIMHLGEPPSQSVVPLDSAKRSELSRIGSESHLGVVILVQRSIKPDGRVARCSIAELEPHDLMGNWEQAKQSDAWATWPRDGTVMPISRWSGELLAFDETVLDRDERTGESIESVSSLGLNRTHALVGAKRPDDDGLVPVSGAY
jgi:hypothetical protein